MDPHVLAFLALANNDLSNFQRALSNINDVNEKFEGKLLAVQAIQNRNKAFILPLYKAGADFSKPDENGTTALDLIITIGLMEMLKVCVKYGIIKSENSGELVHLAAHVGNLDAIIYLHKNITINVKYSDKDGQTAIFAIAKNCDFYLLSVLKKIGFDLNHHDNNRQSILSISSKYPNYELALKLIEEINKIKIRDVNDLYYAISDLSLGNLQIMLNLISIDHYICRELIPILDNFINFLFEDEKEEISNFLKGNIFCMKNSYAYNLSETIFFRCENFMSSLGIDEVIKNKDLKNKIDFYWKFASTNLALLTEESDLIERIRCLSTTRFIILKRMIYN